MPNPTVVKGDISLTQYADHYGFRHIDSSVASLQNRVEVEINTFEDMAGREKGGARGRYFAHQLKVRRADLRILSKLIDMAAEPIDLSASVSISLYQNEYTQTRYKLWRVASSHQWYVSSLRGRHIFTTDVEDQYSRYDRYESRYSIYPHMSNPINHHTYLYLGDMPQWVLEKHRLAEKIIAPDCLGIITKDISLVGVIGEYDSQIPFRKRCPLLIAYIDGFQPIPEMPVFWLLAAWGLEHELPKSLGGLLEG